MYMNSDSLYQGKNRTWTTSCYTDYMKNVPSQNQLVKTHSSLQPWNSGNSQQCRLAFSRTLVLWEHTESWLQVSPWVQQWSKALCKLAFDWGCFTETANVLCGELQPQKRRDIAAQAGQASWMSLLTHLYCWKNIWREIIYCVSECSVCMHPCYRILTCACVYVCV